MLLGPHLVLLVVEGQLQPEVEMSAQEPRGLQRKSSLAAMFETMGSAELIRMDADEVPINSASAMAIDLGWDLSAKKVGLTLSKSFREPGESHGTAMLLVGILTQARPPAERLGACHEHWFVCEAS